MAKRSKRRSKQHRLLETTEGAGLGRAQAANHRQDRHGLSRALTEARNQSTISARLRASCSSQRSFRSTSIASQRHAWASSTANKYMREWKRRNKADAKRKLLLDADAAAAAENLASSGYSANLQKVRYSDQKPAVSPRGDKRKPSKSVNRSLTRK
eukprot:CAMPEP_0185598212 /NCGR_PEP_ID=MMETSP0434-20130131/81858_1 /TAXON_ID=626734 ORGANISM="Favella taraikaensis, Strain Fe Narragansett Bay" /NCGR_SAMPLE_ID=MMETSP0434 /ASSEMBLY_ACC=CAM_ASM_000379 /LENGTH=155 /DNA_ID=CAMNT_0028227147 /DNA_START=1839 /DNA_END=2305 /DNA_ORIENTATION=-